MKTLVIGASGQVGNALVRALKARGHHVTGTYRSYALPGLAKLDASDSVAVEQLIEAIQPDWIFYPAGLSWVDLCEREPERCFFENVHVPIQVAQRATAVNAGFVYFSSEYIFDGYAGPYDEGARPNPLNIYGKSKFQAEQQLADNIQRLIIVRTTVVYGTEVQQKNFVHQLLKHSQRGQPLVVPNDQISTPTYNVDLAIACVECAERQIAGVINLVGPDRMDRHTFAVEACHVLGLDPQILISRCTVETSQVAPRPLAAGLVNARARQTLSTPMRGITEGLVAMKQALASPLLSQAMKEKFA